MSGGVELAARNQLGLHARTAAWLELGRGLNLERIGELRICRKKVVLVNAAEPLPNLAFLI